jgi:hypothetical protein
MSKNIYDPSLPNLTNAQPGDRMYAGRDPDIDGYVSSLAALDPWAAYGTPAWRTDFTTPAALADWTVANGSASDLVFTKYGAYKLAGAPAVFLTRPITPGVPFVADYRWTIGNAGTAATPIYCLSGVQQDASTARFVVEHQQGGDGAVPTLILRNYSNTTMGGGPPGGYPIYYVGIEATWPRGVTDRIYGDGTTYRFRHCFGGPATPSRISAGADPTYAVTSVTSPAALVVAWTGPGGQNHRLHHVAYQTTPADVFFGL